MDWFSILLLVLFFVLPLIQRIVEGMKQQGPQLPPEEVEELEAGSDRAPRPVRVRPAPTQGTDVGEGSNGWSDGWVAWPTEVVDEPDEPERAPAELEAMTRHLPVQYDEPTAPTPVIAPIDADKALELWTSRVPWDFDRPESVTRAPRRPSAPATVSRGEIRPARPRVHRVGDLRRAIVLSEVLGPPVSLRPPHQPPPG